MPSGVKMFSLKNAPSGCPLTRSMILPRRTKPVF